MSGGLEVGAVAGLSLRVDEQVAVCLGRVRTTVECFEGACDGLPPPSGRFAPTLGPPPPQLRRSAGSPHEHDEARTFARKVGTRFRWTGCSLGAADRRRPEAWCRPVRTRMHAIALRASSTGTPRSACLGDADETSPRAVSHPNGGVPRHDHRKLCLIKEAGFEHICSVPQLICDPERHELTSESVVPLVAPHSARRPLCFRSRAEQRLLLGCAAGLVW